MRTLGLYALLTRLASGDLSDVFLARRDADGETCAVKLYRADVAADAAFSRLLLAEGPAAVELAHPVAAQTFEVGRHDTDLFSAQELIRGQPLSALLQRVGIGGGPSVDPKLFALILAEIAAALGTAHLRPWASSTPAGMVHGGLCPRAVMLGYDGAVRLVGLGAGRARLHFPPTKTRLAYAAPEVLSARAPDHHADLFAFGAMAYEMISGRRLFRRTTDAETRQAILEDPIPPIRAQLLPLGEPAADLLANCVHRSAGQRPRGASDLAAALREGLGESEGLARAALSELMLSTFREERDAQMRVLDAALRRADPALAGLGAVVAGTAQTEAPATPAVADTTDSDGRGSIAPSVKREVKRALIGDDGDEEAAPGRASSLIAPAGEEPPKRIARYQIRERLWRENGVHVYRARDPNVGRRVLLKVIDTSKGGDGTGLPSATRIALLQREARIAGRVLHPSIAPLLDAGRDGALYFLSYAFIEGVPLDLLLSQASGRPSPAQLRSMVRDLADALGYLHGMGLVHGDVRASNVRMGTNGRAHFVDLSMASTTEDTDHPLRARRPFGLAPEYLHAGLYTPRSDQFALGALLYSAMTGQAPFVGEDDDAVREAVLMHAPPPPETLDPAVDRALSEVVMRMLDKSPERRFESLSELAVALSAELAPKVVEDEPTTEMLAAHTLLVEPALARVGRLPALAAEGIAIVEGVDAALALLPHPTLRRVFVAEDEVVRFAREAEARGAEIEIHGLGPLAERVLGGSSERVDFDAQLALLGRVAQISESPASGFLEALDAIREVAQRLGVSEAEERPALLAFAARAAAARCGLPPTHETIASLVPIEAQAMFGPLERLWTIPNDIAGRRSRAVEIVAAVELFARGTREDASGRRSSPRTALMELRAHAESGRIDEAVVEALVGHLRDIYSALDVPVRAAPRKKILIAGDDDPVYEALSAAGFEVESMMADAMMAWNVIAQGGYDALVLGADLGLEDTRTLLRLVRSGPRTELMPLVLLGRAGPVDDDAHTEGPTVLFPAEATPDQICEELERLLAS